MFVGDGPPRRSIHRPWDWSLLSRPYLPNALDYCNELLKTRTDKQCLQIRGFVDRFEEPHLSEGEARFCCFCTDSWLATPHRCRSTALTLPAQPACIPPRGWLPWDWICRDIFPNDRDYVNDTIMVRRTANPTEMSMLILCSINFPTSRMTCSNHLRQMTTNPVEARIRTATADRKPLVKSERVVY